jgi:hypothetical protein
MTTSGQYARFADIYEEWSALMTADVPFYVDLAREADGPVVATARTGERELGLFPVEVNQVAFGRNRSGRR